MAGQTIKGKAFEYACLMAFEKSLRNNDKAVSVENSKPFLTAKEAFELLNPEEKDKYAAAAETAAKLVFPLEPRLMYGGDVLILSLNADSAGIEGDVRDLLCIRVSERWEIGLSCKHNHEALKHPRITESCDFGSDWVGRPCSEPFLFQMHELVSPLNGSVLWEDIEDKQDRYYLPILKLYCDEIRLLCSEYPDVPERMLGYFFGANDFYKIISQEKSRQTKIEGFNMYGTMNKSAEDHRPIYRVSKLRMPTRLLNIQIKNNSKTTLEITFDNGWAIKMRLHNKDKEAKSTGLAWDVNLIGMPPELYQQQRSWDE